MDNKDNVSVWQAIEALAQRVVKLYVTKSELISIAGNIESVLDRINGEEA